MVGLEGLLAGEHVPGGGTGLEAPQMCHVGGLLWSRKQPRDGSCDGAADPRQKGLPLETSPAGSSDRESGTSRREAGFKRHRAVVGAI
jgi:hypothetical protein